MADGNQTGVGEKTGGFSPAGFVRETKQEISKVTWPTRKETVMTTVMIVVMAVLAGVFFLLVDSLLGFGIGHLLGMKG